MQLSLTFPDAGHPDVLFIATEDSLAKDALEAAAKEWLVDPAFIEHSLLQLSYSGEPLPPSSTLFSKGVEADSQLTVSLVRCIGKKLLTDASTREKIGELIENGRFGPDRILRLDTPTFTNDAGCLDFNAKWIPEGILNICFANPSPSVTSTAPYFLAWSNITSVDLMGLQYVTSIGRGFLSDCGCLNSINLDCLQNVSSIDRSFLDKCGSLEMVDFCTFEKMTIINDAFLHKCSSLRTISNISGLRNVVSIGGDFLYHCSSLTAVDLTVFTGIEKVGHSFLDGCRSLEKVDLRTFGKITALNNYFLNQCSGLKLVSNITGLGRVNVIGCCFMGSCSSMPHIDTSVPGWKELKSRPLKKVLRDVFQLRHPPSCVCC